MNAEYTTTRERNGCQIYASTTEKKFGKLKLFMQKYWYKLHKHA
jgi:hypothetical protein